MKAATTKATKATKARRSSSKPKSRDTSWD